MHTALNMTLSLLFWNTMKIVVMIKPWQEQYLGMKSPREAATCPVQGADSAHFHSPSEFPLNSVSCKIKTIFRNIHQAMIHPARGHTLTCLSKWVYVETCMTHTDVTDIILMSDVYQSVAHHSMFSSVDILSYCLSVCIITETHWEGVAGEIRSTERR